MKKKPNFFIVGAPKAGTTSLYYYLEEHPEVYMSVIKETNYFSNTEIREQGLYYNEEGVVSPGEYEAQFAGVANENAIGEASVSYLFYPSVPQKIKEFNPGARIIIVLRNPIERVFSHYLMDKRLGFVKMSLEDILSQKGKSNSLGLFYQQYIGLGLYYEQVKRYFDNFGRGRVKVFLYEDIVSDIDKVVKEIYNFLGVDDSYIAATDKKHNVFLAPKNPFIEKLYTLKFVRSAIKKIFGEKLQDSIKNLFFAKEKKPQLEKALENKMIELFSADIFNTGQLIDRGLSNWLKKKDE